MKDLQTRKRSSDPYIPVISPILHVMSLTVVVWLRRGFGFSYLRPLSVVITVVWVHLLFTIYALHSPAIWQRWGSFCLFGILTALLYAGHYLLGFIREMAKKGSHDQHSGDSWLSLILKKESKKHLVVLLQVVVEPLLVLILSLVLVKVENSGPLSTWLKWAGIALFTKEGINHWYLIRGLKRTTDVRSDAEGLMLGQEGRKMNLRRNRSDKFGEAVGSEIHSELVETQKSLVEYAQILRMQPPYSAEKAKESFLKLMKGTDMTVEELSDLRDAIGAFDER